MSEYSLLLALAFFVGVLIVAPWAMVLLDIYQGYCERVWEFLE